MKPASPSPYKRFGRGGGNNLLSSPTSSSYREKEKEIYLNSQDSEFRERKLKLWGRVKGALGRWAQLRRMTKYGLAWLSGTAQHEGTVCGRAGHAAGGYVVDEQSDWGWVGRDRDFEKADPRINFGQNRHQKGWF